MEIDLSPKAVAAHRESLGVPLERIPKSVAIIMDGNGRWATSRGLSRSAGHEAGAKAVSAIVTAGVRMGLECLTLYSFSIENWQRPKEEVQALMAIYAHYLISEQPEFIKKNVRLRHVGRRQELPDSVLDALDDTVKTCDEACSGMTLSLALNYGSRAEMVDAVQKLATDVADGKLSPEQIDEDSISNALTTAGLPDPDLIIRTAGEMRLSNFLLWQSSYAEYFPVAKNWPDFTPDDFDDAIRVFAGRDRRFGALDPQSK